MRNEITGMTLKEFLDTELDIWELKYMSTSDEEDNDSDIDDSSEEDEESSEGEEKSQNSAEEDKVPTIFKRFKRLGRKGPPRVQYSYDYSKGEGSKKTVLVSHRVARKGPDSMIELLITQKQNMYERE
jgi:hypothetical protein